MALQNCPLQLGAQNCDIIGALMKAVVIREPAVFLCKQNSAPLIKAINFPYTLRGTV